MFLCYPPDAFPLYCSTVSAPNIGSLCLVGAFFWAVVPTAQKKFLWYVSVFPTCVPSGILLLYPHYIVLPIKASLCINTVLHMMLSSCTALHARFHSLFIMNSTVVLYKTTSGVIQQCHTSALLLQAGFRTNHTFRERARSPICLFFLSVHNVCLSLFVSAQCLS